MSCTISSVQSSSTKQSIASYVSNASPSPGTGIAISGCLPRNTSITGDFDFWSMSSMFSTPPPSRLVSPRTPARSLPSITIEWYFLAMLSSSEAGFAPPTPRFAVLTASCTSSAIIPFAQLSILLVSRFRMAFALVTPGTLRRIAAGKINACSELEIRFLTLANSAANIFRNRLPTPPFGGEYMPCG